MATAAVGLDSRRPSVDPVSAVARNFRDPDRKSAGCAVTTIDGKEMLKSDVQAWRVWEGKDSVTFFVRRWDKDHETQRSLLTLDKESIEKTEISGYDRVLRLLYRWPGQGGQR